MTDLNEAILDAWQKIEPRLKDDPRELQKRLSRRRKSLLTRPPRHWCLAIRASDRRITPAHWVITPEHAMDLNHEDHPYERVEHEVLLQPHALRKYLRPVRLDDWGEEVPYLAKLLGSSPSGLRKARHAAQFTERSVRGLGGKHGKYPIPILHSRRRLDPSFGRFFAAPDPIWGALWEFLPDMIPDRFEQPILRRPFFKSFHSRKGTLFPNPKFDDTRNWRDMSPSAAAQPPYLPTDHRFNGWRWLCPGCKKEVKTIYYPLPVATLFDQLLTDPAWKRAHPDFLEKPAPTFACHQCHRIRFFCYHDRNHWNHIIAYLTRGLLFGHEVKMPIWHKPTEKRKNRAYRHLHRPAPRRQQVLRRLLVGWSNPRIARELHMSIWSLDNHIRILCRQEDVPDRHALAEKLGASTSPPFNQIERAALRRFRVKDLLLQGLSNQQIKSELSIDDGTLNRDLQAIYRLHDIKPRSLQPRRALAVKLQRFLPPTPHELVRQKIFDLLLTGLTWKQIAIKLHMTEHRVEYHARKLKHQHGVRNMPDLRAKFQTASTAQPLVSSLLK